MAKFVRVGDVTTVPGDQEVATVERCHGKVQGVTTRIIRHDMMHNVRIDHFGDGVVQCQQADDGQCSPGRGEQH